MYEGSPAIGIWVRKLDFHVLQSRGFVAGAHESWPHAPRTHRIHCRSMPRLPNQSQKVRICAWLQPRCGCACASTAHFFGRPLNLDEPVCCEPRARMRQIRSRLLAKKG